MRELIFPRPKRGWKQAKVKASVIFLPWRADLEIRKGCELPNERACVPICWRIDICPPKTGIVVVEKSVKVKGKDWFRGAVTLETCGAPIKCRPIIGQRKNNSQRFPFLFYLHSCQSCVQVCFEVEKQFFNGINTHTKKSTSTWNTRVTRDRKDNGRTTLSAYLNFFLNIWSVHQRRRRCDGKHLIDGITSKKEIRFGGCRQSCVWNASKFRLPQRK